MSASMKCVQHESEPWRDAEPERWEAQQKGNGRIHVWVGGVHCKII